MTDPTVGRPAVPPPAIDTRPGHAGRAVMTGAAAFVRCSLRGVWLRGRLPTGAFVWAANHHNWWDPFVAATLLHRAGHTGCLLMAGENLDRYRFVRHAGVFGTDRHRDGLAYLAAGRALVVYPEGALRPAGPPGPLRRGAAWYAAHAGVPLYAAATRVLLRGQQAPEAYVATVEVPAATTEALGRTLADTLADLDHRAAHGDPRAPLPGFTQVVQGRRSWDERLDALARVPRRTVPPLRARRRR